MRKLTLTLNLLTGMLFAGFFVYTFLAKSHLQSLARDFVTQKTLHYSGPVIATVEKALDAPLVGKLVSKDDIQLVRNEIAAYRRNPASYIADLTGQQLVNPPPNMGAIAKQAAKAKQAIREFYNKTLAALITDLRIFSGTNVAAAILAIVLTIKSRPPIHKPLIAFSFLLSSAVIFCSCLYIDDLTVFRILTFTHLGWWYPVIVVLIAARLYKDIGGVVEAAT